METDTPMIDKSSAKYAYDGNAFFRSFFNINEDTPSTCCDFKQIPKDYHVESTETSKKAWAEFKYDTGITVIVVFWEKILIGKYWNVAIIGSSVNPLYSKEQFRDNTNYEFFYYYYSILYPDSTWILDDYLNNTIVDRDLSDVIDYRIICRGIHPIISTFLITWTPYDDFKDSRLNIDKLLQFPPHIGNIVYTYARVIRMAIDKVLNKLSANDVNDELNDTTKYPNNYSQELKDMIYIMPFILGGFMVRSDLDQINSTSAGVYLLQIYTSENNQLITYLLNGLYDIAKDYMDRRELAKGWTITSFEEPLVTYYTKVRLTLGFSNV